jgi:curved DNA-binding protein CbpA
MSLASATGSLYGLIGVGRQASRDEIQSACLRIAAENLPENNPDDPAAEATFRQAERVYEVLGDPVRRAAYDRDLELAALQEKAPEQSEPVVEDALPLEAVEAVDSPPELRFDPEPEPEPEPAYEPEPVRKSPLKRAMTYGFASGAIVAAIAVVGVLGYEAVTKGPDTPVAPDRHQAAAPRIPS